MADYKLGWIEPKDRTYDQQEKHLATMAKLPKFAAPKVAGGKPPVGTKLLLTDLWKHQSVIDLLGSPFTGLHQLTGSCVGVGGGNTIFTTVLGDRLKRAQAEKIVFPWFWYNYGLSRLYGGMRGPGEGSFGSTFAKSWNEDGSGDFRKLLLPEPKSTSDGWVYGEKLELEWSDGTVKRPEVAAESNEHKGTSTQVYVGEGVRDFILNGYGCTRASSVFVNPGTTSTKNGVNVGRYSGRGGHQESWLGYWNHEIEGELIWEQNQWGLSVYGKDPGGGPDGGCWVRLEEVDRMCQHQDAEVFAFSNYDGYPSQPDLYDWVNNSFFS